jgi:hypothetical protein
VSRYVFFEELFRRLDNVFAVESMLIERTFEEIELSPVIKQVLEVINKLRRVKTVAYWLIELSPSIGNNVSDLIIEVNSFASLVFLEREGLHSKPKMNRSDDL